MKTEQMIYEAVHITDRGEETARFFAKQNESTDEVWRLAREAMHINGHGNVTCWKKINIGKSK
jgi:hypothetical protein